MHTNPRRVDKRAPITLKIPQVLTAIPLDGEPNPVRIFYATIMFSVGW